MKESPRASSSKRYSANSVGRQAGGRIAEDLSGPLSWAEVLAAAVGVKESANNAGAGCGRQAPCPGAGRTSSRTAGPPRDLRHMEQVDDVIEIAEGVEQPDGIGVVDALDVALLETRPHEGLHGGERFGALPQPGRTADGELFAIGLNITRQDTPRADGGAFGRPFEFHKVSALTISSSSSGWKGLYARWKHPPSRQTTALRAWRLTEKR